MLRRALRAWDGPLQPLQAHGWPARSRPQLGLAKRGQQGTPSNGAAAEKHHLPQCILTSVSSPAPASAWAGLDLSSAASFLFVPRFCDAVLSLP